MCVCVCVCVTVCVCVNTHAHFSSFKGVIGRVAVYCVYDSVCVCVPVCVCVCQHTCTLQFFQGGHRKGCCLLCVHSEAVMLQTFFFHQE